MLRGAGLVFFAYIGFDAVSTAAQEAKNPQRDLPIGILGSLVICTVLYVVVSPVLVGMVPYTELNVAAPVAYALEKVGAPHLVRILVMTSAPCSASHQWCWSCFWARAGCSTRCHAMGSCGGWAGKVHPKFPHSVSLFDFHRGSRSVSPPDSSPFSCWASW